MLSSFTKITTLRCSDSATRRRCILKRGAFLSLTHRRDHTIEIPGEQQRKLGAQLVTWPFAFRTFRYNPA